MDLDDLIRRAQAGDREALDVLMSWADGKLRAFFSKGFNSQDVMDLVQDVNVVLLSKLPEFESEHPNSFGHYVLRVAGLQAMSRRREGTRAWGRKAKLDALIDSPQLSPTSQLDAKEQHELLTRCMRQLPQIYRRALEHEFAGGDNESFARLQGISLSAARTRRFRAHQLVETLLEDARVTPTSAAS